MQPNIIKPPSDTVNATIAQIVFTDAIPSDVSGDFTLPDYLPAIRKIVSCTAQVMQGSRFVSGSDTGEGGYIVNFGGDVAYTVLYISEDGDLCGCNLRDAYDGCTSIGRQNGAVTADTAVLSCSCRVTAPRKLTLKSKLKTRVTVCGERDLSLGLQDISQANRSTLQYLSAQKPAVKLFHAESPNYRFTGEMNLPDAKRLIKSDAKAVVNSIAHNLSDSYVTVSGECVVKCVYADGNGIITVETGTLPFSEEVDLPGADVAVNNASFSAHASVGGFDVSESDGVCDYSASCIIDVTAAVPYTAAVCTDAYSTACPCEVKTREIETLSPLSCTLGTVTVAETVTRTAPDGDVIDTDASVTVERAEVQDGRLELHGAVKFTVLCGQSDNATANEYSVPFKYSTPASKSEGEVYYRCNVVCPRVDCTPSGDSLALKTEAHLSLTAASRPKHGCVETVSLAEAEPFERDSSVICLYYPESGETLWSAAKKYRVPLEAVAQKNKLTDVTPNMPLGTKPLLI